MHPLVLRIAATCKEHCGPQCYEETITLSLADRLNHKKNETWVALSIAEGLYVSRQTLAYDMQQVRPSDQLCTAGLVNGRSTNGQKSLKNCQRCHLADFPAGGLRDRILR